MAKPPLTERSTPELEKALRSAQVLQMTTAAIFAVIILVWIFGGYVGQNLPVFITTVVMAIVLVAIQQVSTSTLRKEIARRR